ncbi:hypothetical protein LC082_13825 [Microbacterium esteraromaticum]|uniref:hypothetical protein n=1 Tax=Microbacterium esteraromaticum TaxID=57043 RepID=UPI0015C6CCC3|nr:hypothetical protein [Microbacterium esteraromaticum]MCA1307977.1 hypothetical protein [Microbacterium esteraromaticum]
MTSAHPIIDDPTLGRLTRAETTLDDGDTVIHDWYAASIPHDDRELDLIVDGADIDAVRALLPRARALVTDIDGIRRRAADAVFTRFSDADPTPAELDAGATDLQLDAIEVTTDETVLHFTDACGQHFPTGYWPAAHLSPDGEVQDVTVES